MQPYLRANTENYIFRIDYSIHRAAMTLVMNEATNWRIFVLLYQKSH